MTASMQQGAKNLDADHSKLYVKNSNLIYV